MRNVLAVLVMLSAACAGAEPNEAGAVAAMQSGLGDPSVRAKLLEMALKASAGCEVPMPKAVTAVASPDHQVAEALVSGGSIVNEHQAVYVVLATGGDFKAESASRPPGVSAPTGIAITLTIDAQTFNGLDFGILKFVPDLHEIDPNVVDLLAK